VQVRVVCEQVVLELGSGQQDPTSLAPSSWGSSSMADCCAAQQQPTRGPGLSPDAAAVQQLQVRGTRVLFCKCLPPLQACRMRICAGLVQKEGLLSWERTCVLSVREKVCKQLW
jgi:hypothetical protein